MNKESKRRPTFDEIITYYEIADELRVLDKKVREQIGKDYSHYKGLQILMTPLVINPKVMLVGIHPGSGYFKNYKNEGLTEANPIYIIDHHADNNKPFEPQGTFVQLIRSCFLQEDLNILKKGSIYDLVWCNLCPIATISSSEYRGLLDLAGTSYAWKTLHRSIHRLANLIKPQLILCLGKEAFKEYCNNEFINDFDIIETPSIIREGIYSTKSSTTGVPIIGAKSNKYTLGCDVNELQQIIHSFIS